MDGRAWTWLGGAHLLVVLVSAKLEVRHMYAVLTRASRCRPIAIAITAPIYGGADLSSSYTAPVLKVSIETKSF